MELYTITRLQDERTRSLELWQSVINLTFTPNKKIRFMSNSNLNFNEFSSASKADWIAQIEKELKGSPYSSIETKLGEDWTLFPVYNSEDISTTRPIPNRKSQIVQTVEAIEVSDATIGNAQVLELLNKGCSGITLFLHKGIDLGILLKDVLIEHISLHFVSDGEALEISNQLERIISERGLSAQNILGSVNADPIENILRTGNWFHSEESDFETLKELNLKSLNGLRTLCVNGNIYHNSGASVITELGFALAHAHAFIAHFGSEHANKIQFNLAIGRTYLVEVAKYRALRKMWAKVLEAYNSQEPAYIYAETGLRNKTIYDPNVNMLRTTSEAMSALIGGIDELNIQPFDITYRTPSSLAKRVARNQALVMQYEAFVTKVKDPASGSYAIEKLTNELCEKAWQVFSEIEAQGGFLKAVKAGFVQSRIEEAANIEQASYDSGQITLVGTNKFPNLNENMKSSASSPMFNSGNNEGGVVRKLQPKRLSEKEEMERLNAEKL